MQPRKQVKMNGWALVGRLIALACLVVACGGRDDEAASAALETPTPTARVMESAAAEKANETPTAVPAGERPAAVVATQPRVIADTVNLRAGPSTDYPVIGQARLQDELTLVARNDARDWLQILTANGRAWIYAPLTDVTDEAAAALPLGAYDALPAPTEAVVPRTPAPARNVNADQTDEPTQVVAVQPRVTVNVANLRAGPSTDYPVIDQARLQDELTLVARNDARDWLQIRTARGLAWIYAPLTDVTADAAAALPLGTYASLPAPTPLPPAPAEPRAPQQAPASARNVDAYEASLDALVVAPHSNTPPYDRGDWHPRWRDADGDCQDTRAEVLIAESSVPVVFRQARRCTVDQGLWVGPWSGTTFSQASDVDVDHHVPLKNAHVSGGAAWSRAQKEAYANDLDLPAALQAMEDRLNQQKSAYGPEAWKPPLQSAWCQYARDWIDVKTKYRLSVTAAEKNALHQMLATCREAASVPPAAASHPISPPPAPLPVPVQPAGGSLELLSCDADAEVVTFVNTGSETIRLADYRLEDKGPRFTHQFRTADVIGPNETWSLVSGPGAVEDKGQKRLLFQAKHIWNNDGDTAFLYQGETLVSQVDCRR